MISDQRVATGHLLDPKPQPLTEQERQHMKALAQIMYEVYARQKREKPEKAVPRVAINSPRVFTAASTAPN
jgi:hypothetical protein